MISASPIPGNETLVAKTIDNLLKQGAEVLYSRISLVHVHGHAAKEELKMMLSIVKPRYFVPIHGEYRHLIQHAAIASDMGMPGARIFVLEDGDVLELDESRGEVVDEVRANYIYIDGNRLWDMDSAILGERMRLSRNGVVTVTVTLSSRTGLLLTEPGITSSGFIAVDNSNALFEKISKKVASTLEDLGSETLDLEEVRSRLTKSVRDFIYGETRQRPTVLTVIEHI